MLMVLKLITMLVQMLEDMDEESPSHREVNLVQPESLVGSHLSDSDHKEYDDHKIGYRAADNVLPVVVSPKKTISNERLKIILRKWRQRAMDKRFLREQKNALAIAALSSVTWSTSSPNCSGAIACSS